MIRKMAKEIGMKASEFGGQSFRIGGATDHHAAGTPQLALQISGRWDTDIFQARGRPPKRSTARPRARSQRGHDRR